MSDCAEAKDGRHQPRYKDGEIPVCLACGEALSDKPCSIRIEVYNSDRGSAIVVRDGGGLFPPRNSEVEAAVSKLIHEAWIRNG